MSAEYNDYGIDEVMNRAIYANEVQQYRLNNYLSLPLALRYSIEEYKDNNSDDNS